MAISCSWSNGNFQVRLQYDGTRVPTFIIKYDPLVEYAGKSSIEAAISQSGAEDLYLMLKAALDQANLNWRKSNDSRNQNNCKPLVSPILPIQTAHLTDEECRVIPPLPEELKDDDTEGIA